MKREIVELLKQKIVETLSYTGVPGFPDCVEVLSTFEALVKWLGTTDFSETENGSSVAAQELVRVANSLGQRGVNLRKFAEWTLQQPIEEEVFRSIVTRDAGRIVAMLDGRRWQNAFEEAFSLAVRVAEHVPGYRAALAQWVLQQVGG